MLEHHVCPVPQLVDAPVVQWLVTKERGANRQITTRRKVADLTREIGLGHGGSLNTRIKEFVRPALTNQSIHAAVQDYLNGGARKRRIVEKYGEISNWDTSSVTYMQSLFYEGGSFNQPLHAPWYYDSEESDSE